MICYLQFQKHHEGVSMRKCESYIHIFKQRGINEIGQTRGNVSQESPSQISINLFDKFVSDSGPKSAYMSVWKNKGAAGIDGVIVEKFAENLIEELGTKYLPCSPLSSKFQGQLGYCSFRGKGNDHHLQKT